MGRRKLTYEIISAAVKGEMEAQNQILKYYEGYLNALSTVEEVTETGEILKYIDEDMKAELQIHLLETTKKWHVIT